MDFDDLLTQTSDRTPPRPNIEISEDDNIMFDTDLSDSIDLDYVVDLLQINGQIYADKVD